MGVMSDIIYNILGDIQLEVQILAIYCGNRQSDFM